MTAAEGTVEGLEDSLQSWADGLSRAVARLESLAAKAGKFDEGKHPRTADGKFGSGGGGAKEGDAPEDAAPPGPPGAVDAPAASGHAAAFAEFKSKHAEAAFRAMNEAASALPRLAAACESAQGKGSVAEMIGAQHALSAGREAYRQAVAKLEDEERLDFQAWAQHKAGLGGGRLEYYETSGTKWKEEERMRMVAAHDLVASILPAGHDVRRIGYDRAKEGRAYYAYGRVHVTRADDAGTYAHEIGHHLEDKIPGAKEKVHAFLAKRCGDEQPAGLREKFGAFFGADEQGRADDFGKLFPGDESSAYYVGKTYPGGETEVLSMGLELLYRRPQFFARTDPEFFDLVVGIVGNAGKKEGREAKDKEKDKKEPGGGKA